jgi:hypothetical protein
MENLLAISMDLFASLSSYLGMEDVGYHGYSPTCL